ncbi:hypothetical protein BaRGS_00011835 [Batillaria attramentaria]|uniref:Uncharacterized protein n=1 Tax=Batillaria attramentaria TaxID=370345 RepID=A0ABD0LC51_9CAEN
MSADVVLEHPVGVLLQELCVTQAARVVNTEWKNSPSTTLLRRPLYEWLTVDISSDPGRQSSRLRRLLFCTNWCMRKLNSKTDVCGIVSQETIKMNMSGANFVPAAHCDRHSTNCPLTGGGYDPCLAIPIEQR